jgi:hypothetical protein
MIRVRVGEPDVDVSEPLAALVVEKVDVTVGRHVVEHEATDRRDDREETLRLDA